MSLERRWRARQRAWGLPARLVSAQAAAQTAARGNIRGGLNNFAEVYPDEGDMDFLSIMRILRNVQFSLSICPDHMPSHPDDPGKLQAYAFGYGYINALIHAVNSEV